MMGSTPYDGSLFARSYRPMMGSTRQHHPHYTPAPTNISHVDTRQPVFSPLVSTPDVRAPVTS